MRRKSSCTFSLHVNYGKRVREGKNRGKKRRETLQAHLQVLKVGRWAFKAAGLALLYSVALVERWELYAAPCRNDRVLMVP